MNTPDQIAQDVYWAISDFPLEPKGKDLRGIMVAAIEADRAQRPEAATIASLRQEIQYLTTGEQS